MTAADTAQRLGLDEAAVAAFTGSKAEFAQHFAVAESEAPEPAVPPGAPTGVVATVGSTTTASIAFVAPASDGGAEITAYEITSTPSVVLTHDLADVTSPIVVTGTFVQGTAYTFRMKAYNAAGLGAQSAASAAITPNP